MAVRIVTVLLTAATLLLVYASARLVLDDAWLALLVTCVCLWIPQATFMNAVIHPEVITRLLAATVTLIDNATGHAVVFGSGILGAGSPAGLMLFPDGSNLYVGSLGADTPAAGTGRTAALISGPPAW